VDAPARCPFETHAGGEDGPSARTLRNAQSLLDALGNPAAPSGEEAPVSEEAPRA
jgi:hypothetical protein